MPTLLQSWLTHHTEYTAQGRKLALVVGPGGNAGVVSSGTLCAILKLHSFPASFHYVGISAGAYCWMYILSSNFNGATIFGRYFTGKKFFSHKRLLSRRPALSTDYIVDEVLEHHEPLAYAPSNSPYTIHALSSCPLGGPALLPLTNVPKAQAQQALKATAAMPLIGRTHDVKNLEGWDGWLTEHLLLPHLQAQGITDVVWLLNVPLKTHAELSSGARLLWRNVLFRLRLHNPSLAALIRSRLAAGNFLATTPQGLNLEVIQPSAKISPTSRNPAQLFTTLGIAYRAMAIYLGQPKLPYPTEWSPYTHHMPKIS